MDQPRAHAALGSDPIRTIGRAELKAKLDRGGDFKLIMALNRWAFDAKHIPMRLHVRGVVRTTLFIDAGCTDEGAEMSEHRVADPLVGVEHGA